MLATEEPLNLLFSAPIMLTFSEPKEQKSCGFGQRRAGPRLAGLWLIIIAFALNCGRFMQSNGLLWQISHVVKRLSLRRRTEHILILRGARLGGKHSQLNNFPKYS